MLLTLTELGYLHIIHCTYSACHYCTVYCRLSRVMLPQTINMFLIHAVLFLYDTVCESMIYSTCVYLHPNQAKHGMKYQDRETEFRGHCQHDCCTHLTPLLETHNYFWSQGDCITCVLLAVHQIKLLSPQRLSLFVLSERTTTTLPPHRTHDDLNLPQRVWWPLQQSAVTLQQQHSDDNNSRRWRVKPDKVLNTIPPPRLDWHLPVPHAAESVSPGEHSGL